MSQSVRSFGYGAAGTYFLGKDIQLKLSYEKALRMPSTQELFGDGDLEAGKADLKPERSDNVNLNASYSKQWGKHGLYAEGGLIYRHTQDYIKRDLSTVGGTSYGSYTNHGRVETKGFNVSLRYSYSNWFSMGGTFNNLDIRDKDFPLYWEKFGDPTTKIRVPEQLSHNLSLSYSIRNGRYNLSLECRNLTDEKLYDNFSLQKAGRAFYGKFRVYFGN